MHIWPRSRKGEDCKWGVSDRRQVCSQMGEPGLHPRWSETVEVPNDMHFFFFFFNICTSFGEILQHPPTPPCGSLDITSTPCLWTFRSIPILFPRFARHGAHTYPWHGSLGRSHTHPCCESLGLAQRYSSDDSSNILASRLSAPL